jgi:biotin synthase-like enzyme
MLEGFVDALRRGLTAYNHNLDTSREFYPKVRPQTISKDSIL